MSGRVMDLVVCEPCISYGIQMEPHSRTAVEFALDSAGSPERIFPVDALNERNGIFVYRRPAHFLVPAATLRVQKSLYLLRRQSKIVAGWTIMQTSFQQFEVRAIQTAILRNHSGMGGDRRLFLCRLRYTESCA